MLFYLKNGVCMSLKRAALSMGYRELRENLFLKPVGFSALIIDISNLKMFSVFKANGKMAIWNSEDLNENWIEEEYLDLIKTFERENIYTGYEDSEFHFLTPEQTINL